MIGRRCKARERLSRAPLIGRALRDHLKAPSAPDRSQEGSFLERCAAPRAPCERHPRPSSPRRNAPRGPAATAAGAHPDPYRTRKLSRPAPMVLQGRPCGRAGRRRPPGRVARARGGEARTEAPGKGDPSGSLFRLQGFFALTFHRHATRLSARPPRAAGGLLRSGASRPPRAVRPRVSGNAKPTLQSLKLP